MQTLISKFAFLSNYVHTIILKGNIDPDQPLKVVLLFNNVRIAMTYVNVQVFEGTCCVLYTGIDMTLCVCVCAFARVSIRE